MGGFLAIVVLVIYIPSFFHWILGSHTIATGTVQIGSIEYSINADAYLIRDEEVINSPFEGTYIPTINEGEKSPSNFTIATVLNSNSRKLLDQLKQNDQKIINAQMQKMENKNFFSEDIKKLDGEIKGHIKTVIEKMNENDISQLKDEKTKIDELIKKKATIIGDIGTPNAYITSLNREKQRLQQLINQNTKNIVIKESGVVSYFIDGYETELNTKGIRELTPQYLEKIKSVETQINNNRSTDVGKPFAKLIKNIKYDMVVPLDTNKTDALDEGDYISVRINDIGKLVDGKVIYKSAGIQGKSIIAIETDQALSETAGMRKINVDLVLKSFEGYKVPISCLRKIKTGKGTAKIMLVKAGTSRIKEVRIVGKDSEYAIIENLDKLDRYGVKLYDYYVLDPRNIKEGQLIEDDM
ncbi:MAG TPA: HlyD family efflux transporter periplasmic adaptor subunit [Clostridia bacterium]|nr:HlyD family efflux transporter periplasmic adaptor subunit [Clostridia bacterium]